MQPGVIVFDIIYNPLKTRLLMEAEMRGLRVITGIEMLIWQGAYAFELWTGESAPLEIMRTAALIGVGKNED
jgi:shikimate dehydrogenase